MRRKRRLSEPPTPECVRIKKPYTEAHLERGVRGRLHLNRVPQLTACSGYAVDVSWTTLEKFVVQTCVADGLDLSPDFQRGHVWTEAQQIAFVEFCLRGGSSGRDLYFNCPGWTHGGHEGPYQIVDGLQRLTAVRAFMGNELEAFGHLLKDCVGFLRMRQGFKWHVNELKTRKQVLTWYLEINEGGTPHSTQELSRVRGLLEEEV